MSDDWAHQPALALGAAIDSGRADPREITDYFLDRISTEDQDNTVYVRVTADRAKREAAEAADRAKTGFRRSPLDGVPLSWKELFDVRGEPSTACSKLLAENIAAKDALTVERLTRAGAVLLGKTTMTELAFSGLGINPIFGTPANPHDPDIARAPGGSSSGAGVSVARGLAAAALGTDTGGSVRIPAAWNGLVGLKTSWGRVPLDGTVPLSPSLDTIGPLTHTVADAATLFSLLSGATADIHNVSLKDHAVLVPDNLAFDGLDTGIAKTIEQAIHTLGAKGLRIVHKPLPALDEIQNLAWEGASILIAEAYGLWGADVERRQKDMFSSVASRFMMGKRGSAPDLAAGLLLRDEIQKRYAKETEGYDAVLMPTVAISPPEIEPLLTDDAAYGQANSMALRNTTLGNQLGLCALTLPVGSDALGLPVGLMMQAAPGKDEPLLRLGRAIEMALAG
ncbi:MAG: amidase family protein [Parvibaculaceae bacterium]|nr:amidase family protein [Parvibaculaceae bacterium]HBM89965.1 amidase [Rhodobiaceae bacterium]|tara:strand:- start:5545 stop:6903 length:1359 start_codon:yes stop_codon:yes gene_type:complete